MNGSRSHSSRPGASGSSLDSLNRTIEGLEARIESMLGRGSDAAAGRHPATPSQASAPRSQSQGLGSDLLEDIRARQRALDEAQRNAKVPSTKRPRTTAPSTGAETQSYKPTQKAAAPKPFSAGNQDPRPDLSQQLVNEMTALRREMSELRAEARDQSLPKELRQDLAGISASIDALGTHDGGADALRLELDSMRSMVDQLAREDSVRSLESRWQSMEQQVSGLDMTALREELVNLAYRVDEIREFLATMPASGQGQAIEDKILELSQTIEAMTHQSAAANPDLPAQFEMLGARLDEITRAISAMPAPAPAADTAHFERLEARLASVAQKIDELEPSAVETEIGSRIEHLATRVAQLADEEAIARLDARIENLQSFMENGAREDRMPELAEYLSDITGKIEALDARGIDESLIARLDQLADQIETLSVPAPQAGGVPDAVIGRLEALIGRAEATVSRSVDPLPGLETLDARLADIAHKLQQAEVTAAGHAMQPVNGLENVEAQLAEISARLDRPYIEQAPVMMPGIENLEARLADIAERLDSSSTGGSGPSDQAMRGLEDQISNLSRLISSAPSGAGSEAFDERLASIEEHLATSDEFVVEAARQAAEAALSAYSGQMGSTPTPQSLANMEVITALADDLKALEGLSRKTEDRTTRAFEAVQETMLKIAGRLERLDSPAPASHSVVEAQMPRTSSDVLDAGMQASPDYQDEIQQAEANHTDHKANPARTPSEAAAMAAAYAASQQTDAQNDGISAENTDNGSEKSFLSGLAARIRPGKDNSSPQAEPQFTEDNTPPLDPSMEMDAATANMPLEPGSGAPDINRILQKVREAQVAERQRDGGSAENGSEKSEFLASARRAAMAAAAEVETIGKGRKTGGGMLEVLKSRRRPMLMAAGAVLLAIMSYPLVSGLLSSDNENVAVVEPAIVEPATVESADVADETQSPVASFEDEQQVTETRLPEVRVIEPGQDAPAELTEISPPVPSPEATAAIAQSEAQAQAQAGVQAEAQGSAQTPAVDTVLTAALDALPADAATGALKAAAAAGNPLAFYEIGARFTEGRGVPVDLKSAATWYQRAADLGHAPSQYRIANFYEKGSGLERDLDAAKKWYQLSAEQGNASAMHNLAVLYATAGAVPDYDSAAQWFDRAAEVGVRDSQVNLAILYARGDGVPRDLEKSYKWFAIAANDGDKDAAVKRDEVFNALRPEQAEAARASVANWTAEPINPDANEVEVPASWQGASTETAAVDMSKAIRNIQAILNNNGFDAGAPDGVMGKKTVAAIKQFQASIGMEPTGEIDDALVQELLARNG